MLLVASQLHVLQQGARVRRGHASKLRIRRYYAKQRFTDFLSKPARICSVTLTICTETSQWPPVISTSALTMLHTYEQWLVCNWKYGTHIELMFHHPCFFVVVMVVICFVFVFSPPHSFSPSKQLGDIFTIHAAGKRMTFITNPRDYSHYFQTTLTDFQAAVQPFTKKAGIVQLLCLRR